MTQRPSRTEKSGARILCTVGDFLGTEYVDLLHGALGGASDGGPVAGLPALERIVLMRGDHEAGQSWSDFLSAGFPQSAST